MKLHRLELGMAAERLSRSSLAIFAFFAVASIALQNFIFLGIAAWLVAMGTKREWKLSPTAMNTPLLMLGAVLLLASIWAGRLNPSFFGLRKVGLIAVFFLTTATITHPLKANRVISLFVIGAALCAGWSILTHLLGWDGGRARSFSGDYMAAGGMYMLGFVLALSRYVYQREAKQWFWLGCAVFLGIGLLLTYTRSSWIGAAVALLILGIFRDWRLPLSLLLVFILLLLLFPKNPISQRIVSITSQYQSSNVERRYMWISGFKMVMDQPLVGYGVDNLSENYGRYADPNAIEQTPPHVHNTLLQLAINGGVAAMGFFIWWVIMVFTTGWRAWLKYRNQDESSTGAVMGIIAAFSGFVVNGLFEFNFGTAQVITIVFFLTGLLPAFLKNDPPAPVWSLPRKPKLLFIRPRFRGDVLLASIIPHLIKRDFPGAEVDLLTEPGSQSASLGQPGWDEVLVLERKGLGAWWEMVRRLRHKQYDAACDLFGNPRSAILSYVSGARFKIGPAVTFWEILFDYGTRPDRPGPRPAWETYLDILRGFGIKQLSLRPHWEVDPKDEKWILAWMKSHHVQVKKIVGIFPGGSHSAKRWPIDQYVRLAQLIQQKFKLKPIMVFGPLEEPLKKEYQRQGGKLSLCVEHLTTGQLAALWSHCAVVVSNDAFPMHLGPAVATPTIGLFGPGDPRIWFPYSERSGHRAIHRKQECWPCHKDECINLICWEAITVNEVLKAVGESLKLSKTITRRLKENE